MSKRRRKQLPPEPVAAVIDSMTHEGRGVGHIDGKAVFIDGALPGEEVLFKYTAINKNYDEGETVELLRTSPHRVEPGCPHFGICGGCSLQHLAAEQQVQLKQQQLLDNLQRIAKVQPEEVLVPLIGPRWGYRRKARLGVKYVTKKGKLLIGFRERRSAFLADLGRCDVLHPAVGQNFEALRELISGLSCFDKIPQIEVAASDDAVALVFRHLAPLTEADQTQLRAFGETHGMIIYLQSAGPDSVHLLWPESAELKYAIPDYDAELVFRPADFTQVNSDINRAMVAQALARLEPRADERVLDLFCGLGNFTLPLARLAGQVTGVEGEAGLVQRARENAQRNGVSNAQFFTVDLSGDFAAEPWAKAGYDKMLLDPPRSGAAEIVVRLRRFGVKRVVYVSCNPATLARDAEEIVHRQGYRLVAAGIMDMFPHTAHVESMAVFEK